MTDPTKLAPTTAEERARWKELCAKATPGPWVWRKCYEMGLGNRHWAIRHPTDPHRIANIRGLLCLDDFTCPKEWNADPDVNFVAESRTAIPRLLADIDRLEAVRVAAHEAICQCEYPYMGAQTVGSPSCERCRKPFIRALRQALRDCEEGRDGNK